jgi:hypothetical protein
MAGGGSINQFYVTLSSDASMDLYPDNVVSSYKTKLSEPLNLTGDWEVGLCEVMYVHAFNNVHYGENQFIYDGGDGLGFRSAVIQPGHYDQFSNLSAAVKSAMSPGGKRNIDMAYNPVTRKVTVDLINGAKIFMYKRMAALFGFKNGERMTTSTEAPYVFDITGGIHAMHVYTNIVNSQIVGHTKSQLLRLVGIIGQDGEVVTRVFQTPYYLGVAQRYIDCIEIEVTDQKGERIRFNRGRFTAVLHFRKSRGALIF